MQVNIDNVDLDMIVYGLRGIERFNPSHAKRSHAGWIADRLTELLENEGWEFTFPNRKETWR